MPATTTRRRFLRASGLVAAGLAGCSAPRTVEPLAERATTQFRVTTGRHGFRDVTTPDVVERQWRLPNVNVGEHTAAKASPLPTPSGDVVVPGDSGLVYRVGPDGTVRWRAATDPSVRGIHGTPAVANGAVYVGAYDGALYAFDLETGIRRWRTRLGDSIGSSPVYHDGRLFVGVEYATPSGSIFGVDAGTGDVVWRDDRPTDQPHSSPAIDLDAGRIVMGANDGNCYAWTYPSLEFAWQFETGEPIKGPVATADGAAFVGSWDHHVFRLALSDGSVDWSFQAGDKVMTGPGLEPGTGVVYVGSHDQHLYALDVETGESHWSFETGGWLIGCPALTDDRVLVGSYDGYCYCLDRSDGAPVWRAPGTGQVTSTPLVHDGAVYFTDRATSSETGALYKYAPA